MSRPTISVTLPPDLVTEITNHARERGLTRSALISLVLTDYIKRQSIRKEKVEHGRVRATA